MGNSLLFSFRGKYMNKILNFKINYGGRLYDDKDSRLLKVLMK
jgi:hypothetical protein